MTTPILTEMASLDFVARIFDCLTTHFTSHTRAKVKKLKLQLNTSKKDKFLLIYLLDIKKVVDLFIVVGAPISPDDQIDSILDDLLDEYDNFFTYITS